MHASIIGLTYLRAYIMPFAGRYAPGTFPLDLYDWRNIHWSILRNPSTTSSRPTLGDECHTKRRVLYGPTTLPLHRTPENDVLRGQLGLCPVHIARLAETKLPSFVSSGGVIRFESATVCANCRRWRGDMIEVFKITHTIYDETFSPHLPSHMQWLILQAITTNSLISSLLSF